VIEKSYFCVKLLFGLLKNSVTRKLNNILPIFLEKVAKNAKISTPKVNLKAQNIHIKLIFKHHNKPRVQIACLGEN